MGLCWKMSVQVYNFELKMWNKHTKNVVNKCKFPVHYSSYLAKPTSIWHIICLISGVITTQFICKAIQLWSVLFNGTLQYLCCCSQSIEVLNTYTNDLISYSLQILLFLIQFIWFNIYQYFLLTGLPQKCDNYYFWGINKILVCFLYLYPMY